MPCHPIASKKTGSQDNLHNENARVDPCKAKIIVSPVCLALCSKKTYLTALYVNIFEREVYMFVVSPCV